MTTQIPPPGELSLCTPSALQTQDIKMLTSCAHCDGKQLNSPQSPTLQPSIGVSLSFEDYVMYLLPPPISSRQEGYV